MEEKARIIEVYRKKDVVNTFDDERDEFLYQREKHKIESNFLIRAIKRINKNKLKILDVGCGTGRMLPSIFSQNKNIEYFGLDSSKEMTKILNEKAKKMKIQKRVKIVIGDATKILFKDNSFDLVFSYHLLWHVPKEDEKKMLSEMIRVTKKEGIVLFDVLNKDFIWERLKEIFYKKEKSGIYKVSIKELREMIGNRKYESDKILDTKVRDTFYPIFNIPNKIRNILPKNLFHMLYFKIKK